MSKVQGTGPIYISTAAALHMGSWSINGTNEVVEDYDLVDNSRQADYGVQSYSGSASGVNALEDTTGQDVLKNAFKNKTKLTDIKFYLNYTTETGEKAVYWQPTSGSGGVLITSLELGKDGGSETSKISFSWTCDGLMEEVVETVS